MNNNERIELINRVCEWVFNNTESFEHLNIGSDLSYLVWAIAANSTWLGKDDDWNKELINVIKANPNGLWDELVKQEIVDEPGTLIEIHVRGGLAYPPEHVPNGIRVEIIDHDEERR